MAVPKKKSNRQKYLRNLNKLHKNLRNRSNYNNYLNTNFKTLFNLVTNK
jgi:hypothetical protein